MNYFNSLTQKEREAATFMYEEPEIIRIPNVLSEERFSEIVSFKGYADIDADKKAMAHEFISGLIYRATGLFYGSKELTLRYNANDSANVFVFPFRCMSIESISSNGHLLPVSEYEYDRHELRTVNSHSLNSIFITGHFGCPAEEVHNDIELAISILIEDYVIGDKYDRMQSMAKSVTLDKLSITLESQQYDGSVTGNKEVDRLLLPHAYPNSPLANGRGIKFRMTAL
jgi:hypothetical protein